MTNRRLSAVSVPVLLFALAALALALVVLQPVCSRWLAHHTASLATAPSMPTVFSMEDRNGDSGAACCASVGDPGVAMPAEAFAGGLQVPPAAGVVAAAGFITLKLLFARQKVMPRAPPPGPSSFYLRSARIRR